MIFVFQIKMFTFAYVAASHFKATKILTYPFILTAR